MPKPKPNTRIEIDGRVGEGGGQILRTALSLSCLLDKPFRITNIRKGRQRPGLMPQHLMCVQALKTISQARVTGDSRGSTELRFEPRKVRAGEYSFDIGTAGSTALLLQAILPPLVFSGKESRLVLQGGTHVPFSPPFQYISDVFVPMLGKFGIVLHAGIERYGFYPRGGGWISLEILPAGEVKGINFLERGEGGTLKGISAVGNLPMSIAERQKRAAQKVLADRGYRSEIETQSVPTPGKGTFLFLTMHTDHTHAGFSSLGARGKRAESVGEEASQQFLTYASTEACLDPNLADQIVPYLAMAGGEHFFSTSCITKHLLTNLLVIKTFLGTDYRVDGAEGSAGTVTIQGGE